MKQDNPSDKVKNVQIDYDDVASMTHALEQHKLHTIISAIGLVSDETSRSQLNLIDAAEKSASTKRFIPSEYSFIQTAKYVILIFLYPHTRLVLTRSQSAFYRPKYSMVARRRRSSEEQRVAIYQGDPWLLHGLLGNAPRANASAAIYLWD